MRLFTSHLQVFFPIFNYDTRILRSNEVNVKYKIKLSNEMSFYTHSQVK